MQKWVTLGLVVAAALGMTGSTFADVPSSLTSTVGCSCIADGLGGASGQLPNKCTIAPTGKGPAEDIKVQVVVKNVLGAPLAGSTVNATAVGVSGSSFIWDNGIAPPEVVENPQTGTSDGAGNVTFTFDEGGASMAAAPVMPNLNFTVTAQGPGPGGPVALASCSPQLSVLSFDLNADGNVNLTDFAIHASDLGGGALRSDFNWSGATNLTDFAQFAAHLGDTFGF